MKMSKSSFVDTALFRNREKKEFSAERNSLKVEDPTAEGDEFNDDFQPAPDFVKHIRRRLGINQHTGTTLDINDTKFKPSFNWKRDSHGFRIPDDDAVKFYCLTEDEAVEVLRNCLVIIQDDFLLLNKPPGISAHAGVKQRFYIEGLLARLAFKLKYRKYEDTETLQLVHRLDKEATGAVLISRNRETHLKLTEAFANRWIEKTYLCITSGIPTKTKGDILLPLSERDFNGIYKMVAKPLKKTDDEDSNTHRISNTNAITHYNVLDKRNDAALVECTSLTGIKHQIRVHLSSGLQTPVIGDHKYSHFSYLAPQRLSRRTLDALNIRQSKARYLGLHLHCHKIKFLTGKSELVPKVSYQSVPPPTGFFSFIKSSEDSARLEFTTPIPQFFLSNMKRLRLSLPRAMQFVKCKYF